MTMLISIWINMIVIPCEKKNVRADRKPCVWKYFVLKITEFMERQKEKKNFLKYRALFYHD